MIYLFRFLAHAKKVAIKKPIAKKQRVQLSPKVNATPSIFFKFAWHVKLWASISKRTLLSERTLHSKDFTISEIVELLGETNLLGTISKLPPFVLQIILEFYVNLFKDMGNPVSLNFQKTAVRGHSFEFSPSIINMYYLL